MKTFFISHKNFLKEGGGGAQWCTREFLQSIKNSKLNPEILLYQTPQELWIRLLRKIIPIPFFGMIPTLFKKNLIEKAKKQKPKYIFLNNSEAATLAPYLRNKGFDGKIIFLSHGAEITDVVNNLRLAPSCLTSMSKNSFWLGNLLKNELQIREALDGVFCVSETDLFFEKWLGAKKSFFLPRQIKNHTFKRAPIPYRVGLVATLNHGPNLHGLKILAQELVKQKRIHLRLVGSPDEDGKKLAKQYKAISFLGALSNEELKKEAATWCAFVNPIFCYARGVSTKVATALSWGLPILTTPIGSRGYRWDEKALPTCTTPEDFVNEILKLSNKKKRKNTETATKIIIRKSPKTKEISKLIRKNLNGL